MPTGQEANSKSQGQALFTANGDQDTLQTTGDQNQGTPQTTGDQGQEANSSPQGQA